MEIAMNSKFTGMSHQEMMNVDGGGGIAMAVIVIVGSMASFGGLVSFATKSKPAIAAGVTAGAVIGVEATSSALSGGLRILANKWEESGMRLNPMN